jgi:hypothetical protein
MRLLPIVSILRPFGCVWAVAVASTPGALDSSGKVYCKSVCGAMRLQADELPKTVTRLSHVSAEKNMSRRFEVE